MTRTRAVIEALDAGQACLRREAAGLTLDELDAIEAGLRGARRPSIAAPDGRVQPPLCAARAVDEGAARRAARAEGLRDDGQRRRDPRRSLDAGSRRRRRPHHRRGLPLHRSAALSRRRADRLPRRRRRWTVRSRRHRQTLTLALRRRLASARSITSPTASRPSRRSASRCSRPGRVLQLDNFRTLHGFGWPGFRAMNLWRQDKGQKACAAAFVDAIRNGGPRPDPL